MPMAMPMLPMQVLGTVKDACLVAVGVLFLHEAVSRLQLVGYSLSLAGFLYYNLLKAGVLTGRGSKGSSGGAGGVGGVAASMQYGAAALRRLSPKDR